MAEGCIPLRTDYRRKEFSPATSRIVDKGEDREREREREREKADEKKRTRRRFKLLNAMSLFGGERARRSKDIARNRGHLDKATAVLNLHPPDCGEDRRGRRETELLTSKGPSLPTDSV